jgi:hypothetical protein
LPAFHDHHYRVAPANTYDLSHRREDFLALLTTSKDWPDKVPATVDALAASPRPSPVASAASRQDAFGPNAGFTGLMSLRDGAKGGVFGSFASQMPYKTQRR